MGLRKKIKKGLRKVHKTINKVVRKADPLKLQERLGLVKPKIPSGSFADSVGLSAPAVPGGPPVPQGTSTYGGVAGRGMMPQTTGIQMAQIAPNTSAAIPVDSEEQRKMAGV